MALALNSLQMVIYSKQYEEKEIHTVSKTKHLYAIQKTLNWHNKVVSCFSSMSIL